MTDIPDVVVDCVAGARIVCIFEKATTRGWEPQYVPMRGTVQRIIRTEFHTYVCLVWDEDASVYRNAELSITAWWSQASGSHTQDQRSGFSLEKDEEKMRAHLRLLTLQDLRAKASKMWADAAAVDKIVRECTPAPRALSIEDRRAAMRGKWNHSAGMSPFHPIHGSAFEITAGVHIMSRKYITVGSKTGAELGPESEEDGYTVAANTYELYRRIGTEPAMPGTPVWDELQRRVTKGIEAFRLTHFYGVHENQNTDGTIDIRIRGAHYTPPSSDT